MATTPGYSGKPLLQKLGYLPGDSVYTQGAPKWFNQELLTGAVHEDATPPATWAHLFVSKQADLKAWLTTAKLDQIEKGLWVSWPKKTSGAPTDITEQTLRDIILPMGWVDVKVAAVDDTYSGLKFLRRKV